MTLSELGQAAESDGDLVVLTKQEARDIADAIEEKDAIADALRRELHRLRGENARQHRALIERRAPAPAGGAHR